MLKAAELTPGDLIDAVDQLCVVVTSAPDKLVLCKLGHMKRGETERIWAFAPTDGMSFDVKKRAVAAPVPESTPYPASLPPIRPSTDASEALDILYREATVEGRHYLPCSWLKELAHGARSEAVQLTPAQKVADKLLDAAFEYEGLLNRLYSREDNELIAKELWRKISTLREAIEPLRPLPAPTLEEVADALRTMLQPNGPHPAERAAAQALLARVPK